MAPSETASPDQASPEDAVQSLLDSVQDIGRPFRYTGRPVSFTFAVANVDQEVMHMTREIPHGWLSIDAPGHIKRAAGIQWTKDHAFLQCNATGDAILIFVVLKEDPIYVMP